jgi:hypothetical protein
MAYNRIPFKTSRGVAAYIESCAPAGLSPSSIFPHKSSGYRSFPNVTVLVTTFTEAVDNPGSYQVNILVSVRTTCDPSVAGSEYDSDALVGEIADLFEEAIATDRSSLADLITAAGRSWAVDGSAGADPVQAAFAAQNADLQWFKVDSIVPLPNATSGVETDEGSKFRCWVDDFPFALIVRAVSDTEPAHE